MTFHCCLIAHRGLCTNKVKSTFTSILIILQLDYYVQIGQDPTSTNSLVAQRLKSCVSI